jgi:hypothetical protein
MSHHGEDHAHGEAAHAHPPPGLPEVKDEAGDTPSWVPKLGVVVVLGLLGLLAYALVPLQAPASDAPAADEQTEAEAEAAAAK